MKISIIGTNGFLSGTIASYYDRQGGCLDMYGLKVPENHSYTHFYPLDLLEKEPDSKLLAESDLVVYAAGAGIQSDVQVGNNPLYRLNVQLPVSIFNGLREVGYNGIFLSFGSYFEMGKCEAAGLLSETAIGHSDYRAPNDYAVSKRMLTRFFTSVSCDFTFWHFILPTIYGEKENPARLIPYTVDSIKNNKKLCFTSGEQVRQYIYVKEVVKVIEAAYECRLGSGIYNVAGNETLSVREIVGMVHAHFGIPIPPDCFGSRERADAAMKYLALDGSKLYSKIHFYPRTTIKDILNLYGR